LFIFGNELLKKRRIMKKLILLIMVLLISLNAYSADQWTKTSPSGSSNLSDLDTNIGANNEALDRLLSNYRNNVRISYNNVASVSISAGEIVCSNVDGSVRRFRKNTSSITSTWVVGTNGLDAGSESSSTTYYVYAVADADAETFTILISTNSSAPTGATYYKRLGSFYNNSSSNIEQVMNDSGLYIVTGTVSNGGTISLPAGFSESQCSWFVSSYNARIYDSSGNGGCESTLTIYSYVNSSRVYTGSTSGSCRSYSNTFSGNYIMICNK